MPISPLKYLLVPDISVKISADTKYLFIHTASCSEALSQGQLYAPSLFSRRVAPTHVALFLYGSCESSSVRGTACVWVSNLLCLNEIFLRDLGMPSVQLLDTLGSRDYEQPFLPGVGVIGPFLFIARQLRIIYDHSLDNPVCHPQLVNL